MRYDYQLVKISDIQIPKAPKNKLQQESLIKLNQLNPIKLRLSKKEGFKYELVDGRRRLTDLIATGATEVEALIEDIDNVQLALQGLALNSGTPNKMDEAIHIQTLLDNGYTVKQISKSCNFPLQIVYNRIKLLNLIPEIQELLLTGSKRICYSSAIQLANLPVKIQYEALESENKKISSKVVTDLTRKFQASKVGSLVLDIENETEEKPSLFLNGDQMANLLNGEITINYNGKSLTLKVINNES